MSRCAILTPWMFSVFIGILFAYPDLTLAGGRAKPDLVTEGTQSSENPLTEMPQAFPISQIYFGKSGTAYPRFASIAAIDSLNKCPLESFPVDLASLVNQLTLKVRESVAKIKATHGSHCTALANRLNASQAQLGDALKNQFLQQNSTANPATAPAGGTASNQDLINAQTQRAGAANQLVLTVSDLVQRDCISSIDDRIAIQRLVGQIVTLGGLFWGGWQGILTAIGGQLIGNIPVFTDELDAALKVFKTYDESTERGSFLCLFRQMQKTSCSLFSRPQDEIIEGFDLSFASGPAFVTFNSVEAIKKESPEDFHDVKVLYKIHNDFSKFLNLMEKNESLKNGSVDALHEFREVCTRAHLEPLEDFLLPTEHPPFIVNSLTSLVKTCDQFKSFQWAVPTSTDFSLEQGDLFWNVLALSDYYKQRLKSDTDFGKIAQTYESLIYFQNLKNNFEQYRDPTTGSQARLEYLRLTQKLGETLAKNSFKAIMHSNWNKLKERSIFRLGQTPALPLRQRALTAMLDLCQTLDPTLACLHVGDPTETRLEKSWLKHCAGRKSLLCRDVLGVVEQGTPLRDLLLTDPGYRSYFNSLCGDEPDLKT